MLFRLNKFMLIMVLLFLKLQINAVESLKTEILILEGDSIEPYAIKGKNDTEPSGIQIDLFNAIFKDSPYKPKFFFVPLYRVSTDVDKLHADGATRMFHFTNKSIEGFFSKEPYIKYKGCVVTLATAKNFSSFNDLNRLSIVGFQGASISFSPEAIEAIKKSPEYKEINNQLSQVTLLHLNRVDAIIADIYISEAKESFFAQENKVPEKKLKCNIDLHSEPYYAFFKSKNVRDAFDAGFEKIVKDGTYDKIFAKYNVENLLFKN